MTWIKICGTTTRDDALAAVSAGADAVGFIFAPSPRRIEPGAAAEIAATLPRQLDKVGVFVNESAERISSIARQVGLTAVQLHGDEKVESIAQVKQLLPRCEVFKTLSVPRVEACLQEGGMNIALPPCLDGYLLDSGTLQQPGGTGCAFDWVASQFLASLGDRTKLVVAGGLTPQNVGDAIRLFHPYGVDVCTGVEISPGKKSPDKIRAFVAAARKGGTGA